MLICREFNYHAFVGTKKSLKNYYNTDSTYLSYFGNTYVTHYQCLHKKIDYFVL